MERTRLVCLTHERLLSFRTGSSQHCSLAAPWKCHCQLPSSHLPIALSVKRTIVPRQLIRKPQAGTDPSHVSAAQCAYLLASSSPGVCCPARFRRTTQLTPSDERVLMGQVGP